MFNVSLAAAVAFYFVGILTTWLFHGGAWWEFGLVVLLVGGFLLLAELRSISKGLLISLVSFAVLWTSVQLLLYPQHVVNSQTAEVEVLVKTVSATNKWWTEYECQLRTIDGSPANGLVLVRHGGQALLPGQEVRALVSEDQASQAKNWAPYDQQKYLRIRGIAGILKTNKILACTEPQGFFASWYRFIANLQTALNDRLLEEPSGLAAALLIGNKAALDSEAKYDLQGAGVSHIVALSGFHLVMLISLVEIVLVPFARRRPQGQRWINLCITVLVLFYLIITGFQTSLLRAAIMLLCVRGLRWTGANALLATAAIMVVMQPLLLLDVGFQLSVLAVGGLVLLSGQQTKARWRQELQTYVAVQLFIFPILAWNFGFISLWGLLGNLILTPVSVAIMVLGGVYLCLSSLGIGVLMKPALVTMAQIFLSIGHGLAELPYSFLYLGRGNFSLWVCYYLVLSLWIWWRSTPALSWQVGWWQFRHRLVKSKKVLIGLSAMGLVFLVFVWPQTTLKVFFLDVGEGDCSIIKTPKGRVIVIDTGKGLEFRDFLRSHAISEIDVLLLTHPHADHYKGLTYCLDEITVNTAFLWPHSGDLEYNKVYQTLQQKGTRLLQPVPGQSVLAQEGIKLKFYLPQTNLAETDWNQKGIMLKLDYGRHSFLYTADSGEAVLDHLARQISTSVFTVVKVPHHGSRLSWSDAFWHKVQARWAVISVGKNFYGHPSNSVVQGLSGLGKTPLRTDLARGICFECSKTNVALKQYKED